MQVQSILLLSSPQQALWHAWETQQPCILAQETWQPAAANFITSYTACPHTNSHLMGCSELRWGLQRSHASALHRARGIEEVAQLARRGRAAHRGRQPRLRQRRQARQAARRRHQRPEVGLRHALGDRRAR